MSTVAGAVFRRPCYCLCLAVWGAGFVLLFLVHIHMQGSEETHRYKHTFDDDELLMMSLLATEETWGGLGNLDGTTYPPKHGKKVNELKETRGENSASPRPKAKQQNELGRLTRLTDVQRNRTKTIRDVCLKRRHGLSINQSTDGKPRPQSSTNQIPALSMKTLKNVYVSDAHRFMHCHIPEVGLSNWERGMIFLKNPREAHSPNDLKTLRNYTPEERKWRLDNYKKFMFVRNPVARVIAVYRNKLFEDLEVSHTRTASPGIHRYGQYIVKKYRRNATSREIQTGENVTWSEWMAYLTNQVEEANFDDSWMQMSKLCSPCDVGYDYIGKVESFRDDADYVTNVLNLTDVTSEFRGRENSRPTSVSMDVAKSYFEGVSKKKKRAFWNSYKLDFELFGYDKPDFFN